MRRDETIQSLHHIYASSPPMRETPLSSLLLPLYSLLYTILYSYRTYTYTQIYIHKYIHIYTYISAQSVTATYPTYMYTHTHLYIYTYTSNSPHCIQHSYTHIYKFTHNYTSKSLFSPPPPPSSSRWTPRHGTNSHYPCSYQAPIIHFPAPKGPTFPQKRPHMYT